MQHNHSICNSKTGVCGLEDFDQDLAFSDLNVDKIQLYYFTDPICAHCYALEPILRKFQYTFSEYIVYNVVLGGLLDHWDRYFPEKKDEIASNIYANWKDVATTSILPIDGSIWKEKPISSSFPISKVYEVVEQIHQKKGQQFLRLARFALLAHNLAIDNEIVIKDILRQLDLDAISIWEKAKRDGATLLEQDIELTKRFRILGFPTVVFINTENKGKKLVGQKEIQTYRLTLEKLSSYHAILVPTQMPPLSTVLEDLLVLFYSEIAYYYDIPITEVPTFIVLQLDHTTYTTHTVLGQSYIQKQKA